MSHPVQSDPFAQSDALLAAIVASSDDAIIAKDLNGIIRSWNKGAERIFGYTAAEALGHPVSMLAPPDRNEMPEMLARIRAGERIDHYETVRRRKDGSIITVSLTVSPLRNASGEIVGASKIARDVTDRRAIEATLRATEEQLMLLIEASGAMLASPHSHEVLRTILDLAHRFVAADAYSVWRRHSDGVWRLATSTGLSSTFIESGSVRAPDWHTVPTIPMIFRDVARDPLLASRRETLLQEGIQSVLAIPLNIHGEISGTVVFYWRSPHSITDEEVRIANALGNLAASALATAALYEREQHLRAEAEASERRATLLAESGAVLASSLDYQQTLAAVAQMAVPSFADWAAVDIVDDSGKIQRVAVAHSDPEKIRFAEQLRERYPVREEDIPVVAVRTGKSVLKADIPDELVVANACDEEHLQIIRALGLRSAIVAPMVVGGASVGVLTFVTAESGRRYAQPDLHTAEEIASRAGLAVQRAALYSDVRASEERYRSLISATTSVVWTRDISGAFVVPQESWEAYTGQPWSEHRGHGWIDAMHPDEREIVREAWRRCGEEPRTFEAERRLWHAATGQYRHVIARAAPVRNADGSVREWIGTMTDIHERRVAQEELNASLLREKEARQTAELLNRVGPVLAAELDRERLIQSITDIATELAGAQFGALFYNGVTEEGQTATVYTLSGGSRESFAKISFVRHTPLFSLTFRDKQVVRSDDIPNDERYGLNKPHAGVPAGHPPVRSYLAVPVMSRSGEVLGALLFGHRRPGMFSERHEQVIAGIAGQAAIALDNARLFAESQQSQEALQRSNEELRRANADLEQFAYSASHDLKEPLRMVAVYSQMLNRKYSGELDEQARAYLRYMTEGAQRMDLLVRDLLAYTQAVSASQPAEAAVADVSAVLARVLQNLRRALDESGATVRAAKLPDAVSVHEMHLVQLLQNLIENALKYRGEATPVVEISAEPDAGMWQFSVRDNGIGIPAEYSEQIFGIFKRLHPADRYPGTGIGLAICQKIVNRYGGRIWVESAGVGSVFRFTLPGV